MNSRPLATLALLAAAAMTACEPGMTPSADGAGSEASAVGSTVSINAGGAATGSFAADAYSSGGNTYSTTSAIDTSQLTGTVPPQAVFQTERWGELSYTVPNLTPGSPQTVTLYFAEIYWTAAGQRTFNVAINGATVLTAFDVFAAAGGANRAIARSFQATASASGQVVIQLSRGGGLDNPKISGFTLVEGAAATSTTSVNAGGAAAGSFAADAYFSGGSTYSTTNAIDTAQISGSVPPQAVFQTERYGEFTYTIPNLTPGSVFTVTLYFQESYWTAAGQRTFNVAINGATVLTAFDIFAAAGGANRAIARSFNVTANASGQVVIAFTKGGGPDNPKICGISVAACACAPTYTLTAVKAGTGSGTIAGGGIDCGATCSAPFQPGAAVTLTATPSSGSTFTGWSGACSGTGTCALMMTTHRSVTATFTAVDTMYGLTVTKAGTGSGTVSSNPAGINCGSTCSASYASGTAVTLSAAPASGATFAGWSGACTGTGSCVVTMTAARSVTATFNGPQPTTYTNPVLWEDLADIDILRVDDTYYYSASTMHYSPGAPILRSYDLVNWEYAGHSVPVLDFSSAYDLSGGRAYVKGIWASFLNYRKSNRTFYWGGCIEFNRTYIYTATSVTGPWVKHGPLPCYYDAGLLIDDNDTMYVAYGATSISVAQLSADGFSQVRAQQVFTSPSSIGTLEGARFYKRNGFYYIWLTRPANGQYVLRSTSPWGPYTLQQVLLNMGSPVSGSGVPHQGGLVQTQNGDWYYMAFIDAFPGGRVPVLAPIDWVNDWPVIRTVNGAWGATYPRPNLPPPPRAVKPPTGTDTFTGTALAPEWEWNHNPDNNRWSVGNGLRLQTATVTNDLYQARNTLTHRILGPTSTATIVLNYSAMRDGDRAGLALFRDLSAWVGVRRDGGATRVAFVNNINMNSSWATVSTGTEVTSASVSGGRIWLRLAADIRPGTGRQGRFSYSTDGVNYTQIGTYTMGNAWQFFMGYRYGLFNYATQSLGGAVTVESFTVSTP